MNNLFSNTAQDLTKKVGANYFRTIRDSSHKLAQTIKDSDSKKSFSDTFSSENLIKPEVVYQMANGFIPNLWAVCHELTNEIYNGPTPVSIRQFISVLQRLKTLEPTEVKRFVKNPETRHVLISNNIFELILIHWRPGKANEIHGHPGGGGVFKLLQGKLEELRYTQEKSPRLLSTTSLRAGSITSIDDSIAYHQVGNPYGSPAISIHVNLK